MFLERKVLKYRKFQKNRSDILIKQFHATLKNNYFLVFPRGFHFFIKHLKLLNFFLQKRLAKSRHMSKKEMYRRSDNSSSGVKLFIKTHDFMRNSSKSTFSYLTRRERKRTIAHTLTKMKRLGRHYLTFNTQTLPYTKKAVGSRMGKGKGSVKFWYFFVKPGFNFIQFIGWSGSRIFRVFKTLRALIPGKPILRKSFLQCSKNVIYSSNQSMLFY